MKQLNKNELHKFFSCYTLDRNEKNLEKLYIKYKDLIYSIAYSFLKNKEDAEDIVQNIFLKLQKLNKDRLPKSNEFTWLYAVVKNESINLLKKNCKIIDYEDIDIPNSINIINEVISNSEYRLFMSYLKPLDKKILELKIISGFSFKEISEILNMPLGAVEWKYYKALNYLKILVIK